MTLEQILNDLFTDGVVFVIEAPVINGERCWQVALRDYDIVENNEEGEGLLAVLERAVSQL